MKRFVFPLISLLLVTAACRPTDNCPPRTTRCAGDVAEICDNDRNWQPQLDCTKVSQQSGSAFQCGYVSEQTDDGLVEGHTCMPAGTAGQGGGGS